MYWGSDLYSSLIRPAKSTLLVRQKLCYIKQIQFFMQYFDEFDIHIFPFPIILIENHQDCFLFFSYFGLTAHKDRFRDFERSQSFLG